MAARASGDEERLVDYLSTLGYDNYDKLKTLICFDKIESLEHSGTKEFIEALERQKIRHQEDVNIAKQKRLDKFKSELTKDYGITPEINRFVEFIKLFIKNLDEIQKNKSDVDSSSSTWKTDRFEEYERYLKSRFVESYKTKLEQPSHHHYSIRFITDDIFSGIQQTYLQLAPVYLGVSVSDVLELGQELSFLQQLVSSEYREAASRVFLDALITPILLENRMQVRLEEKLYVKDLPNCIADYVVYNSKGEALGVIETKTGRKVKAESVIQCMLQLLALRTKAPHTLFGVVTDAVRYIFIVLTEDGTFEFERWDPGYYDIITWNDLREVASIFNWMLLRKQRFVSLPLPIH